MGKSTPEERIAQLKHVLHDDDVEFKDKMRYTYHAIFLEVAFWRRNRAQASVLKHGNKLNETIDIVMFVKKLDNL